MRGTHDNHGRRYLTNALRQRAYRHRKGQTRRKGFPMPWDAAVLSLPNAWINRLAHSLQQEAIQNQGRKFKAVKP